MKSLKELYRIGHGPSSSHTMAPALAAEIFRKRYPEATGFEVTLYGSLAATGKGHFTDCAIQKHFAPAETLFRWESEIFLPYHPNAMRFSALNKDDITLGETVFYSTGGGALEEEGKKDTVPERYPFASLQEIMAYCQKEGIPLWEVAVRYDEPDIFEHLEHALQQMFICIKTGLAADGVLPGGLHLPRKARNVYLKARALRKEIRRTGLISAFAYAAAEENASLGIVVTAPTCGSCGVLPAVLQYCVESRPVSRPELLHALAVAGIIGNVVKQNGSVSGAEVGCQGEVGVACAMAAAALAELYGLSLEQVEYAAEVAMEHHLGLTCDPICGLVQIPCIERNAVGALRALNACNLSYFLADSRNISYDMVCKAMYETGLNLSHMYKETSEGGLARVYPTRLERMIANLPQKYTPQPDASHPAFMLGTEIYTVTAVFSRHSHQSPRPRAILSRTLVRFPSRKHRSPSR